MIFNIANDAGLNIEVLFVSFPCSKHRQKLEVSFFRSKNKEMKDIKLLAKQLLSLSNKGEYDENTIIQMKNLICYLSEYKSNYQCSEEDKKRIDYIIYNACVKMRTFGYNRLNGFEK